MICRYGRSSDLRGGFEVVSTLLPYALLWWVAIACAPRSGVGVAAAMALLVLFSLRVFALMHECGHRSLFRGVRLNRWVGFVLGVIAGMPQYVWAQHHNYHHANNGNWEKYRGPYATLSVDEYAALTRGQQRFYRCKCSILAAPLAGFIYLILNPRLTWIKGSVGLARHVIRGKFARPGTPMRELAAGYKTRFWKTSREYRHMTANNVVLLGAWVLMCWLIGPALFFTVYLLSVSVAGGLGIVLFTVQHNFEHAYAATTAHWDYDRGAIDGTSFLVLPSWMNWFTANIGYHHIHHLSSSIPAYHLVACHNEYQELFTTVVRVRLSQVCHAMRCILWDIRAERIITLLEYQQRRS